MKLSELKPSAGSTKNRKRIGRGNGSGFGRTAGKGYKGQKYRKGYGGRLYYEGGQMPLMRRLPKRGMLVFHKIHRYKNNYQIINLEKISTLKGSKIDHDFLYKNNLIKSKDIPLKVLSKGELDKPLEISANFFSKVALEKIEKAGGKAIFI